MKKIVCIGYGFAGRTNLELLLAEPVRTNDEAIQVEIWDEKFSDENSNSDNEYNNAIKKLKEKHPHINFVIRKINYPATATENNFQKLEMNPDIVMVNANTALHAQVIKGVIQESTTWSKKPLLMCEKPLAHNLAETTKILKLLKENQIPLVMFYQYRYSNAVPFLLEQMQALEEFKINVFTQKDRETKGPHRPSAGVIEDEFTHYMDFLIFILKRAGYSIDHVDIQQRDIQKSFNICGNAQEAQRKQYGEEAPNAKLTAQLRVKCKKSENEIYIPLSVSASFLNGPQKREITFTDSKKNIAISIFFDSSDGQNIDTSADCVSLTKGNETKTYVFNTNKKLQICMDTIAMALQPDAKQPPSEEILLNQQVVTDLTENVPQKDICYGELLRNNSGVFPVEKKPSEKTDVQVASSASAEDNNNTTKDSLKR